MSKTPKEEFNKPKTRSREHSAWGHGQGRHLYRRVQDRGRRTLHENAKLWGRQIAEGDKDLLGVQQSMTTRCPDCQAKVASGWPVLTDAGFGEHTGSNFGED